MPIIKGIEEVDHDTITSYLQFKNKNVKKFQGHPAIQTSNIRRILVLDSSVNIGVAKTYT